jgi:protein ImuB
MFACLYLPALAGSRTLAPDAGRLTPDPGQRTFGLPAVARGAEAGRPDDRPAASDLASLAREFSPRVEVHGPGLVTLDARGLERLFGDARQLGDELRRAAADRGMPARIAIAPTRTAAWLLALARAGLTIVAAGEQRRWLAPLPLRVLAPLAANGLGPRSAVGADAATASVAALLALLKRWGLTTLGEFAQLPPLDLSERLGQQGLAWQRVARGEDMLPLVPDAPEERFEETLDLEWPVEGLQPLSFIFGRLFDALSARLAVRDRAAAVLHVQLQLVTREVERRSLQLPAPTRDARVLRTLALLNLEAHPVTAGIDRVTVVADPVPGRIIQHSLLTHALPLPEQLSTLLARLGAVMGEGRCGMAALVDSYRPGAFEMKPFPVEHRTSEGPKVRPTLAIRRFRIPVPAFVAVKDGRPVRVMANSALLAGGSVRVAAGPWRTSGEWWRVADARVQTVDAGRSHAQVAWNRDEWDVCLADGGVYRIYCDRDRGRWFVDGVAD